MGNILQWPTLVAVEEADKRRLIAAMKQCQEAWDAAIYAGVVPTEAEAVEMCEAMQDGQDILTADAIDWGKPQ